MVFWLIVTLVLLVWNVTYCTLKIIADFRGPAPASGIWGLFALAGALSTIAMLLLSVASAAT